MYPSVSNFKYRPDLYALLLPVQAKRRHLAVTLNLGQSNQILWIDPNTCVYRFVWSPSVSTRLQGLLLRLLPSQQLLQAYGKQIEKGQKRLDLNPFE